MTNLTVVSTYGAGAGSTRVRLYNWLDHLGLGATRYSYLGTSKLGISTALRNPKGLLEAEWGVRRLARRGDLETVFISRRASPFSAGGVERGLLTRSGWGVYDFDDALYVDRTSPNLDAKAWRRSVEAADVVIAGNETLAEAALEYNERVVVIPSCVEPSHYPLKTNYDVTQPTVVWMGSPSTEKYLGMVRDALQRMRHEIGVKLLVVSSGAASLGDLDGMTKRIRWGSRDYLQEVVRADVGIMPLVDDAWARGKCAYKLLEYGAMGLPMIGSPVGVNSHVLRRAKGWSPRTTDSWIESLREVFSETAAARAARGSVARRVVSEEYSYKAWAGTWCEVVQRCGSL